MVEYALIMALLAISMGVVLWATGPAIGNVFCNVAFNLSGENARLCGATDQVLSNEGGRPDLFWGTVTWVAANRQGETPFPTPVLRPPLAEAREFRTATPTQTLTPSMTPSETVTPSPTFTASPGPSPTPSDLTFSVPHIDQMNKPAWWRIDQFGSYAVDLGTDPWIVDYYDDTDPSTPVKSDFSMDTPVLQDVNIGVSSGLTFNWGTGRPASSGLTGSNSWGADYTRGITLASAAQVQFGLQVGLDDFARLYVDGTEYLEIDNADGLKTLVLNLAAGTHTIRVQYADNSGAASLTFTMAVVNGNPDDIVSASNCAWGPESDDTNSNSRIYVMDENPSSNTWSAGTTCHLELRGSIDLASASNPVLSFWDYWDLDANAGASLKVQIGNYVLNAGVLDRSAFNWCEITLHSGNTANYNWTRNQINVRSQCPALGNTITMRFVASSATSGNFRWRIDDIELLDQPASPTSFTVGDYWNLNSRTQMSDFVYNADSDHLVTDVYTSLPGNTSTARRWDLTSNISRDGTAWDDSPGSNYPIPTTTNSPVSASNSPYRIHYLEFKNDIDITTARISGLTTDYEGDTGAPILSFWFAYDVPVGASVRLQYTRDARNRTGAPDVQNPDSWTDINGGLLLDFAAPGGTPALNEQVARNNMAMQLIEVPLTNVPNYDTAPFRLRLAFYTTMYYPVGGGTSSVAGDGIYVDDIRIERSSTVAYTSYPFADEAESSAQTAAFWQINGSSPRWGQVGSPILGALGTANSYGDSPAGNYAANASTSMQFKKLIDLLNDTPENDADTAARPAAIDPRLTFYFQRQVNGAAVELAVDLFSPVTNTWSEIWAYNSSADTSYRTQSTWERAEISLVYALQNATGLAWSTIAGDGDLYNDDFRLRFRFDTGSDTTADGVYLDQIEIKDAPTATHRLWSTTTTTAFGTGGGTLEDSIDFITPTIVAGTWDARWYSAAWNQTSAAGFVRRGSLAITDSLSGQYTVNTRNILEYMPVVDLRSTPVGSLPRMFFWTRYEINNNDNFRVEISYEDTANTTLGYDNLAGWSDWTAVNTSVTGSSAVEKTNSQVVNWVREDVNLTSYIGKRIRVRFVMNVPNNTNQADGAYIDDLTFTFGYDTIPLTFTEPAQNLIRWITEGSWGITQQFFAGTGTDPANLGSSNWIGYYFDCENNGGACNSADWGENTGGFMNPILNLYRHDIAAPAPISDQIVGPESLSNINYNFGTGTRPMISSPNSAGGAFFEDWAARWIRQVQLSAGTTYNFQSLSDDGVRLWLNDSSGTSGTVAGDGTAVPATAGLIINSWYNRSVTLDYGQLTITSATDLTNRYLYFDYFENGGDAIVSLSAAVNSYSISDSPNTWNGSGWNVVTSTVPGNVSLMLNGFIDMSNVANNYNMQYLRMYDAGTNNAFYLEVSTDGGFTWSTVGSETLSGGSANIRPANDWQTRTVNLNAYRGSATVTFRFRVDTRSASTGGDGYYVTNIVVIEN
ncbi:MAG: hypothetical protein IPK17_24655 [Chloroflexi bacterium]|uniref:Flp family type IVb pilin n=1 Tax=Candidatus Flexifilum breve TaxID=3140694 RepID=UPI00313644BE|nr:hypothetical protein [Chloroflexota bacterium]